MILQKIPDQDIIVQIQHMTISKFPISKFS